ncbi:unnamed protein product [Peniophora sp. CBMAI 1063]|nr:unnamed protein product [Peniophora sp. CBMAI 1063]
MGLRTEALMFDDYISNGPLAPDRLTALLSLGQHSPFTNLDTFVFSWYSDTGVSIPDMHSSTLRCLTLSALKIEELSCENKLRGYYVRQPLSDLRADLSQLLKVLRACPNLAMLTIERIAFDDDNLTLEPVNLDAEIKIACEDPASVQLLMAYINTLRFWTITTACRVGEAPLPDFVHSRLSRCTSAHIDHSQEHMFITFFDRDNSHADFRLDESFRQAYTDRYSGDSSNVLVFPGGITIAYSAKMEIPLDAYGCTIEHLSIRRIVLWNLDEPGRKSWTFLRAIRALYTLEICHGEKNINIILQELPCPQKLKYRCTSRHARSCCLTDLVAFCSDWRGMGVAPELVTAVGRKHPLEAELWKGQSLGWFSDLRA